MTFDTTALRRTEFPWMDDGSTVYMNAASTGPLPTRSVDAQVEMTRRRSAPHLVTFEDQFGTLARCRALVSTMINAEPEEIGLATNTGSGINLAAWGFPLGPGDEVVVPDCEFPANMYPWLAAARARGFSLHVVPLRDGVLDQVALLNAVARPGVRAVSVSWVGFSNGSVADLERIGAQCRMRDILFVVDGIQGLGALTIDVKRTPVDVFACGAQKWLLGPWGAGFTYVRRAVLERITPQPVSWMAVRGSDDFSRLVDYDLAWRDDARRFEQITLAYQDFAGMAASLDLLRELGVAAVSAHIVSCTGQLLARAREMGIQLVSTVENHAGIASIRPSDAPASSERLTNAGVIHSLREGTIRLAPHCYTTAEDIDRTIAALRS